MREKSEPSRTAQLIPWVPTILGVAALLALMVIAAIRLTPWSSAQDPLLPAPAGAPAFPIADQNSNSSPLLVTATTTAHGQPSATITDIGPTAQPTGRTTTVGTPATYQVPTDVTGHYSVLDSYGDSFIGQVLIGNDSAGPQDWTVVLTFPDDVGQLRTSWLESLPQPTLTQYSQTYKWRSTVPLPAHSSGELRFQFDRPGTRQNPSRCLINSSPCH